MTTDDAAPDLSAIVADLDRRLRAIDARLTALASEQAEESRGDVTAILAREEDALRAVRSHLAALAAEARRQAEAAEEKRQEELARLADATPAMLRELAEVSRACDTAASSLAEALERRAELIRTLAPWVGTGAARRFTSAGDAVGPFLRAAGLAAHVPALREDGERVTLAALADQVKRETEAGISEWRRQSAGRRAA